MRMSNAYKGEVANLFSIQYNTSPVYL